MLFEFLRLCGSLVLCRSGYNVHVSMLTWGNQRTVHTMYVKKRRSQWLLLNVVFSIV